MAIAKMLRISNSISSGKKCISAHQKHDGNSVKAQISKEFRIFASKCAHFSSNLSLGSQGE